MLADVVGYSRLMEADDAATLSSLQARRREVIDPAIADHNGHTIKMMGDGMLVEFHSIVDAVNCAAVIQQRMAELNANTATDRQIELRIGIHLGDIMVEQDDIYGDGVNVAARLEQLTQPGRVSLSEDAFRQVRGKTALNFEDLGSKRLKNRRVPMRVYAVASAGRQTRRRFRIGQWALRPRVSLAISACLIAAISIGLVNHFWLDGQVVDNVEPDFLASNGLPIVEIRTMSDTSSTSDRPYLAAGLTQEFVAALGRFNTLWVVGPIRDNDANLEAGVRPDYRFFGSVQQSGAQVRILARLVDAQDGTVRWTDRYVGEIANLFDFQKEVAGAIAGTLATSVVQLEGRRRATHAAPNPTSFDLILQARALGYSANRGANLRFRELLKKAIAIDPEYAVSHAMLAEALLEKAVLGWSPRPDRELRQAESFARRAVELAPDQPDGYRALGNILAVRGDYKRAQGYLDDALRINPSDPRALATWGAVQSYIGETDLAVAALERALKYDPRLEADQFFDLAAAYYLAGRAQDALRTAERGLSQYPEFAMLHVASAAAAARLGDRARAELHARAVQRLLPYFSPAEFGTRFRDSEQRAYFREGLKRAGL